MTKSIDCISSASTTMPMEVLRRRLRGELEEIREKIATSGLCDEMTREISSWRTRFITALRSSSDERKVCSAYIALLQKLLSDPITNAPLDGYAVLGNDGHTYGQMSLAVYVLSVPAEYRNRSPLNAKNPSRFVIAPHPVVRHMIGWLQSHGALLYSEELEKTYLRLLPQQRPMDTQARIEGILARQAALDKMDADRRRVQFSDFERKLEGRLQAWDKELEQRVAGIRGFPAIDRMVQEEERLNARLAEARKHLSRMAVRDTQEFSRINVKLDAMTNPLKSVHEEVEIEASEERASIARLKERVEEYIHSGFEPLAERISASSKETAKRIEEIADKDRMAVYQLEEVIRKTEAEVEDLSKRNEELKKGQRDVSLQLSAAKLEEIALQQGICETEIAIKEKKNKELLSLISTVGIIAGCCLGTWALSAILKSTSLGVSVVPMKGGAELGLTISM